MGSFPVLSLPGLRLLGRRSPAQPAKLLHAASGLECLFTGSELWLSCEAEFEYFEPWISVELNGAWIARMPLDRGRNRICLVRGMTMVNIVASYFFGGITGLTNSPVLIALLLTFVPDISLAIPKLIGGYVSPIQNPLGPVFIH